jgi:hypothetical protein
VSAAAEPTYVLIYDGAYPDAVTNECLHTGQHVAGHPEWSKTPHRVISRAEVNLRADSRCKVCLPAAGEL